MVVLVGIHADIGLSHLFAILISVPHLIFEFDLCLFNSKNKNYDFKIFYHVGFKNLEMIRFKG